MREENKVILSDLRDIILSLDMYRNAVVTNNSLFVDNPDLGSNIVVDLDLAQFENQLGQGGMLQHRTVSVSFLINIPTQRAIYTNMSTMSQEDIVGELWDYLSDNTQFTNFDIKDTNMIEFIREYPGQSRVYRFDINCITNFNIGGCYGR